MEQLQAITPPETYLPILVLTADITPEAKRRALAGGARDFLTKPFDVMEVLLRIKNLLETRLLYQQLQNQNLLLEERVQQRTAELAQAEAKYRSIFENAVDGIDAASVRRLSPPASDARADPERGLGGKRHVRQRGGEPAGVIP